MSSIPSTLHQSPEPRFLSGGNYRAEKGKDFPPHAHTSWELVYYLTGNPVCPIGEEVYEAVPGTFLVTPPTVIHAEVARTAYSNLFFTVEAPADYPWQSCYSDDVDGSLEQTCRALLKESYQPGSGDGNERATMLAALMTRLVILMARCCRQQNRPVTQKETVVREAERIMEECFREQGVGVEQIASRLGVSVSTLRAAFADVRHCPPREVLAQVRLRHAFTFLRTSDLTLEATAYLCGFDSASHLSRRIKQSTGITPGRLRRENR